MLPSLPPQLMLHPSLLSLLSLLDERIQTSILTHVVSELHWQSLYCLLIIFLTDIKAVEGRSRSLKCAYFNIHPVFKPAFFSLNFL